VAGRRARGARQSSPRSQHFLRTAQLAAELVRDAEIGPRDLVVEIGAGRGRLTEELARRAGRVVAIEIDPMLVRALHGRWENVDVVVGDATTIGLPTDPFRVVSNIPFHRTTDLMHALLDDPSGALVRADLIVQWDVAVKRALPWPSTLNGIVWSAFWEASLARRLPRAAFSPTPIVDAGVLVLRRRATPLVEPTAAAAYRRFVAAGFRKGLGHVAGARRRSGSTSGRIARDLDAHEWASLFIEATRAGRDRKRSARSGVSPSWPRDVGRGWG
jgi:23S rRNA (adenine-N6)-dimethyltransferase